MESRSSSPEVNLPDGITAEQWGDVCERMGWWKPGLRCDYIVPDNDGLPTHTPPCGEKIYGAIGWHHGPHDIPCPPVTDERLMQVLRAGMIIDEDFLQYVNDLKHQCAQGDDLAWPIVHAYLALLEEK